MERILIVENDRIALRNVSQFLSGEGYQVERANNGDEALKLLEKEKFDLVVIGRYNARNGRRSSSRSRSLPLRGLPR